MILPQFATSRSPVQEQMVQFAGLDFRYGRDGAVWDGDGFSSDRYPSLSPRLPTETVDEYREPSRVFAYGGGFLVVDGNELKWNGETVTMLENTENLLIAGINSKIVIFPQKLAVDVSGSTPKLESLECTLKGMLRYQVSANEYVEDEGQYFDLLRCYYKDNTPFLFEGLRINDTISISGLRYKDHDKEGNPIVNLKIEAITIRYISPDKEQIGFYANSLPKLIKSGLPKPMTFKRVVPDVDTLCESNNRLWATVGNTIRASALGDPTNWNRYDGLSDDSYAVDVATDGAFTACGHYGTHVAFFKENVIHKIYGSRPANYQMVSAVVPGVTSGAARTLATVGGVLYYVGNGGVYAYDGDCPTCISLPFAGRTIVPHFGVGTAQNYYLYADIGSGDMLLCYDTRKNVWSVENRLWLTDATYSDGKRYDLCTDGRLLRSGAGNENVEWWVQLADIDEGASERKRYQKLTIRCQMNGESTLRVDIRAGKGSWHEVFAAQGAHSDVLYIPVYPVHCTSLGIRFRCTGDVTIHSITRQFVALSDLGG